jgi:uncharacterized protein YqgC (DUF456 family)
MEIFLMVVAVVLVIAGILGTVAPALPGTPLVFLGLFIAAKVDDFQRVGGWTITLLAILTIISFLADLAAAAAGAKSVDASKKALAGAALGMVVGIFFGIPGLILFPFIGAFGGEYWARQDLKRAGHVGFITWVGYLLGTAAKLALAFAMVGIFLAAYFWQPNG